MTPATWILALLVAQIAIWVWLLKARIERVAVDAAHEAERLAAVESQVALLVDLLEQETAPPEPEALPDRLAEVAEVERVLKARGQ